MTAYPSFSAEPAVTSTVDVGASSRLWEWTLPRLPLLAFATVYAFTCYLGVVALLASTRFRALYFIFSGADLPDLTWRDLLFVLAVLHIAPLALWFGYELVLRLATTDHPQRLQQFPARSRAWVARSAFTLVVGIAVASLARAGTSERNVLAWFDYNAYVYARWRLIDTLTFAEFVNLYTLLPLFGAYVVLHERAWWNRAVVLVTVAMLQYPLANRKALLTSAIIIGAATYIYLCFGRPSRRRTSPRQRLLMLIAAPLCLWMLYLGLTLQTVIRRDSAPFQTIATLVPERQIEEAQVRARLRERLRLTRRTSTGWLDRIAVTADLSSEYSQIVHSRTQAVLLYSLLSPFTRTSICAVVYPLIFPDWHPYYHIDVGLDILRIGAMPDDNVVTYRFLWPTHHRGTVAAPFAVVLYSQGGLWVAVVGSFIVGIGLALCWRPIARLSQPGAVVSVAGSLVFALSVFLAIDSLRNSILVSYGLIWGAIALVIVASCDRLLDRLPLSHSAATASS